LFIIRVRLLRSDNKVEFRQLGRRQHIESETCPCQARRFGSMAPTIYWLVITVVCLGKYSRYVVGC